MIERYQEEPFREKAFVLREVEGDCLENGGHFQELKL